MPSPLLIYPDKAAVLPPQYFGSCAYYAVMAAFGTVFIHDGMRFDKRFKSTHRMTIADTRGTLDLTMPVVKPEHYTSAQWSDVRVSDHGNWWNIQFTALESAYGRTPFFEFYADSLKPFFTSSVCGAVLTSHTAAIDAELRRLLGIESRVEYISSQNIPEGVCDLRRADFSALATISPYYQVRASELGFIPNLSILDLLFNLGPEAPLKLVSRL